MKYYLVVLLSILTSTTVNAQTTDPEKDSLKFVPKNQIGITTGMSGYEVSFMATYKKAHMKSSIGTMAGVNMGYWYFGLSHSKNFHDASRSSLEMISSFDSVIVYRANSEFEKFYGLQIGRSREVRSCNRSSFSGFQFSFDYYLFLNYGERSYRYQDEYLTYGVPPSIQFMTDNNLPHSPVKGERKVMSLNPGVGLLIGLDMVFGTGDGKKGNKRNILIGMKYGFPNIGVDIPIGEKSISDPLNVYTDVDDAIGLTFYHQVLLKLGFAF